MRRMTFLLLVVFMLASCVPAATPDPNEDVATMPPDTAVTSPPEQTLPASEPMENSLAPKPGDSNLVRGNAFVQEASLVIRESYPPQISLNLKGELPTPCHQLRAEISEPTADNKINIDVYSVVNPDMMCTQVTKPFEESVDLGTFASGHYSVFVNGEPAGEFDS